MDEQIYISRLHKGDEEPFRVIFERYHTRLCYFAARLLPPGQVPEDIVQEAFVQLWQKRDQFPDLINIKSFLYTAVKNRCLNILRHDRVIRKYGDLLRQEQPQTDALHGIIETEVLQKIHQALEKLPDGCRNVLHLSYFEEMKNKDIAEQLNVSVNTVKTQKKRALQILRTLLKATPLFFLFL